VRMQLREACISPVVHARLPRLKTTGLKLLLITVASARSLTPITLWPVTIPWRQTTWGPFNERLNRLTVHNNRFLVWLLSTVRGRHV